MAEDLSTKENLRAVILSLHLLHPEWRSRRIAKEVFKSPLCAGKTRSQLRKVVRRTLARKTVRDRPRIVHRTARDGRPRIVRRTARNGECERLVRKKPESSFSEKEAMELMSVAVIGEIEDSQFEETTDLQTAAGRRVFHLESKEAGNEYSSAQFADIRGNNGLHWTQRRTARPLATYAPMQRLIPPSIGLPANYLIDDASVELESKNEAEMEDLANVSSAIAELLGKVREKLPESKDINGIVLETDQSLAQLLVDVCPVDNLPLSVSQIIASFTPASRYSFAGCTFWLTQGSGGTVPRSRLCHWLYRFRTATHNTTVINYVPIWQRDVFSLACNWFSALLPIILLPLLFLFFSRTAFFYFTIVFMFYCCVPIPCWPLLRLLDEAYMWHSAPSVVFQHCDNGLFPDNCVFAQSVSPFCGTRFCGDNSLKRILHLGDDRVYYRLYDVDCDGCYECCGHCLCAAWEYPRRGVHSVFGQERADAVLTLLLREIHTSMHPLIQ